MKKKKIQKYISYITFYNNQKILLLLTVFGTPGNFQSAKLILT